MRTKLLMIYWFLYDQIEKAEIDVKCEFYKRGKNEDCIIIDDEI